MASRQQGRESSGGKPSSSNPAREADDRPPQTGQQRTRDPVTTVQRSRVHVQLTSGPEVAGEHPEPRSRPNTAMEVDSNDKLVASPTPPQQNNQATATLPPSDEQDERPSSKGSDTSSDSGSIAVDMGREPAEVIVEGRNVRKVSIKFPPQQPATKEPVGVPSASFRSGRVRHYRRQTSAGQITEHLPLSQEETSSQDPDTNPCHPVQEHRQPSESTDCNFQSSSASFFSSGGNSSSALYNRTTHVDRSFRARQDIMGGLAALERTRDELTDFNSRLTSELQRLQRLNSSLEERMEGLINQGQQAEKEVDELKIKLDSSEKENMKLKEQAVNQWTARVKAEELLVEEKAHGNKKLADLQARYNQREKELVDVRKTLVEANTKNQSMESPFKELQIELMTKLERLKENLMSMTQEKDKLSYENKKLHADLQNLKIVLEQQRKMIETENMRFLSLKKSYNELEAEKNLLKTSLRGRRSSLGNASSHTRPHRQDNDEGVHKHSETIHLIELPPTDLSNHRAGNNSVQLPPAPGRKRGKSGIYNRQQNTENYLPPVRKEPRK